MLLCRNTQCKCSGVSNQIKILETELVLIVGLNYIYLISQLHINYCSCSLYV